MTIQCFISPVDVDITASAISSILKDLPADLGREATLAVGWTVGPSVIGLSEIMNLWQTLQFSVFFCTFFLQLVSKSMQQFWVNIFWEWKESEIKTFLEDNTIVFFYLKLTKQLSLLMASYLLLLLLHIYSVTVSQNIYEQILLVKCYLSHDFLEEKVQICKILKEVPFKFFTTHDRHLKSQHVRGWDGEIVVNLRPVWAT